MKIICTQQEKDALVLALKTSAHPNMVLGDRKTMLAIPILNGITWKIISEYSEWKNHKCRECAYLSGEKHSIGIECKCPYKIFRTKLSHIKQPSGQACSHFTERNKDEHLRQK